ncbi:MAG: hypothetical protein U0804_16075 [Gemmataceae bacterium]
MQTEPLAWHDPPAHRPTPILHCSQCGRVREITKDDASRYIGAGWPLCCDFVMHFLLPTTRPPAVG